MIELNELLCHVQLKDAEMAKNFNNSLACEVGSEIANEIERLIAPGAVNDLDFEAIDNFGKTTYPDACRPLGGTAA